MRKPKAYPGAEFTFPTGTSPPPGDTQTTGPIPSSDDPEAREVDLKYRLNEGSRHIYTDGSGMTINKDEISEEKFGAGMYDSYMPHGGGAVEEEDTSFIWHIGSQSVANGELFSIREALLTKQAQGWGTLPPNIHR
jgi:hypothetical protein